MIIFCKQLLGTVRIMDKIMVTVQKKNIWVSIDKTIDSNKRCIANLIICTLEMHCPRKIKLLTSEVLEKVNHLTIAKSFDKSIALLWLNGVHDDDVLLFLCNAAIIWLNRYPQ